MRGELDDVEARVRRDLASASADLRAQLVLCLRDFETFRTAVFQASSEAIKQTTEAISAQSAAAATESQRQAELMSQMLIRVNQALRELPSLGKLELPSERLEKQIASLAARIEELVEQLEAATEKVRGRIRRRRWYWLYL